MRWLLLYITLCFCPARLVALDSAHTRPAASARALFALRSLSHSSLPPSLALTHVACMCLPPLSFCAPLRCVRWPPPPPCALLLPTRSFHLCSFQAVSHPRLSPSPSPFARSVSILTATSSSSTRSSTRSWATLSTSSRAARATTIPRAACRLRPRKAHRRGGDPRRWMKRGTAVCPRPCAPSVAAGSSRVAHRAWRRCCRHSVHSCAGSWSG